MQVSNHNRLNFTLLVQIISNTGVLTNISHHATLTFPIQHWRRHINTIIHPLHHTIILLSHCFCLLKPFHIIILLGPYTVIIILSLKKMISVAAGVPDFPNNSLSITALDKSNSNVRIFYSSKYRNRYIGPEMFYKSNRYSAVKTNIVSGNTIIQI